VKRNVDGLFAFLALF